MFGGITFLPQFQQYVQGASATNSGLLLMPMMIAAMALPYAVQDIVKSAVAAGTHAILLFAAITIVGFLLSWLIRQLPFRGTVSSLPPPTAEAARGDHGVGHRLRSD